MGSAYTISCDETVALAEKMMRQHQIRHLPVLDGRKIFGIISDRDVKLAKLIAAQRGTGRDIFVKDICVYDPYVVPDSEPLDAVATSMARRRIGCAIVTHDGAICGIFTTTDACRLLAEFVRNAR